MPCFTKWPSISGFVGTSGVLQAVKKGYSMLLASMDPAPAHSELAPLKTHSRASRACDITVLQRRGFHVDAQSAPLEVKSSMGNSMQG